MRSAMMIYPILFLGLPVLGIAAYVGICIRMAGATPSPPYAPLFFVFAGYGALLLFAVSIACAEWSGMHYVAAAGVIFVGAPWLVIQSAILRSTSSLSTYHRFVVLS